MNSLSVEHHVLIRELLSDLREDLPENIQVLFEKSRDLYNDLGMNNIYAIVRERKKNNDAAYFYNLLHMGVSNGLSATYYNLNTFLKYCTMIKEKGQQILRLGNITEQQVIGIRPQKLIFEYEHFTLHSRIVLDRLNWFLCYFFLVDAGNLYKLYKVLKSNHQKEGIAGDIAIAIDNHREFLDEMISTDKSNRRTERDYLAHRGEITFANVNMRIMPGGRTDVVLFNTNYPLEIEVNEILKNRFDGLINFIKDILNTMLKLN